MSVGLRISLRVTFRFIPLILYWSIPNKWGMIGGCLLAVGILIKDLWFSEITPMNLYLSLYFVVVNLLYFALSVQWVFNFRHVLSYLALGIFCLGISLYR